MKDQSGPTPLVILDVQDAIDRPNWDGKSNPDYLSVIVRLLNHWRSNRWPVVHVKHDEQTPTSSYYVHGPWNSIKKEVARYREKPSSPNRKTARSLAPNWTPFLSECR